MSDAEREFMDANEYNNKFEPLMGDEFKAESVSPAPQVVKIIETLGFDPTNHHNAAKCPYCNPDGALIPKAEYVSLREEVSSLTGYKFAVAEAHKKLDTAGIPPAVGVACDDPTCNSHIAHRVHTVLSQLADMRKALQTILEHDGREGSKDYDAIKLWDARDAAKKLLEVKP